MRKFWAARLGATAPWVACAVVAPVFPWPLIALTAYTCVQIWRAEI